MDRNPEKKIKENAGYGNMIVDTCVEYMYGPDRFLNELVAPSLPLAEEYLDLGWAGRAPGHH